MKIYPAIDLRGGKCVRLYKGDFDTTKVYAKTPAEMLADFAKHGAEWVHMVDLDGAKVGRVMQADFIAHLVAGTTLQIEVGGGIRTTEDIEDLFEAGIARAVVGSICVSNPTQVNEWMSRFGAEKFVLALDCTLDSSGVPKVRTHGWQEESALSIYDVLANYPTAKYVLCTDVSVDGTLEGPSLALYQQMMEKCPHIEIIASGGVGKLEDLTALKKLGVHGVVVGKALYENKFSLKEALSV